MDMPRHNGTRCKEMIIEILEEDYKPLFIDEADRLSIDRIEDLRDIFEMTGVPIVLIGEEGIWGLLRERRRIMSRVAHEVEFSPISPVEVSLFLNKAADLLVPADLCQRITKQADGDFRVVRNIGLQLEKVAKASENYNVDTEMLDSVLSNFIRRAGALGMVAGGLETEVAALGAAFLSAGASPEIAATALKKFTGTLTKGAETNNSDEINITLRFIEHNPPIIKMEETKAKQPTAKELAEESKQETLTMDYVFTVEDN